MTNFYTFDLSNIDSTSDDKIRNFLEFLFVDYFAKEGINKTTYDDFIHKIKEKYINNQYHNFNHVVDATNTLCYILNNLTNDTKQKLNNINKLAIITGMLCHDLGHFGKTGKYVQDYCLPPTIVMVDSHMISSEFLKIYNCNTFSSMSPLEEFHWYMTKEIVKNVGLFDNFDDTIKQQILNTIKEVILATDPASLSDIILADDNDPKTLKKLLVKSADIGTCLKEFDVHKRWANNLMEEFRSQGDLMKTQNIAITVPMFDRSNTNIVAGQLWFYDNYAKPLYAKLSKFVSAECLVQLMINYETWKNMEKSN